MPDWPEHERVEVPELPRTMLAGVSVQVRPEDGLIVVVRETVPVNPLIEATVTVEVPLAPAKTVTLVGFAVTLKPLTVYVTTTV